jgi:hypothetical protein
MVLLLPTVAFENEKAVVPPRITVSPTTTPTSVALPVTLAVVVPSKGLLTPVRPEIVRPLRVIASESVAEPE